ncbi:MAG: catechol 1,2-dioxygenase [Dehalococcoidia bacterium]|nr:catechol 1,2-dioxygenase [Dehalococcoidia bacterium]
MGEIVAAAVCGHVPTVMLPEEIRVKLGKGEDSSLVAGFAEIRSVFDDKDVDTLVIFDTHWFTTTEHLVAGAEHHKGTYTSEELPRVIRDLEYDYPGAPELAQLVAEVGKERRVPAYNATNPNISHHYPTLNLVKYLHKGEKVLSVGVCQTAEAPDFLAFGAVVGEAIKRSGSRAALLASGGMSHRFWPLRELGEHNEYTPDNLITPEARRIDEHILGLWSEGNHAGVIDLYPAYLEHSPEGYFGHYLMLAGALGGRDFSGRGVLCSKYESSLGTGQAHVLFDVSAARVGVPA